MNKKLFIVVCLFYGNLFGDRAGAGQFMISGVPNYDQDVFPIDRNYAEYEGRDCAPVACTMLHGYYDAKGWPRLIPFGSSEVTQNAWGIDTVVRKYKRQLNYTPGFGVYWDTLVGNKLGDAIVSCARYFDPSAAFNREDNDFPGWSKIQSYLNANRPCVLAISPRGASDSYKWEGFPILQELDDGHAVCAAGWSDVGGRWVICNMGWSYATTAWFNYDSDDYWYISQITPGGTPSAEDDDANEDNDTISTARLISPGIISNLRCLDTLIVDGEYRVSYGDWFKVSASAGQSLSVTITFTNANGDLDLRLYDPTYTAAGSSEGTGNTETVNVSSTILGYYYIFVYGYNNAQNQNYTINLSVPAPSAPTANTPTSITSSGFTANWTNVSGATGYRLDVSTSGGFNSFVPGYQNLDVGSATSRNVSGLSIGTKYYYRARAYNNGGSTSINSNAVLVGLRCYLSGHAYELTPNAMLWNDAENWAVTRRGHLVAVNSQTEQNFLLQYFGAVESIFIGLTDQYAEGVWATWSNGQSVTYSNWISDEPNNVGPLGESFAAMNSPTDHSIPGMGQWNDLPANVQLRGIVEYAFIPVEPAITTQPQNKVVNMGDNGKRPGSR